MEGYTAENNEKVNKLVLPPIRGTGNYRAVARDAARARGLRGIPKGREEEISPTAWFDQWWAANLALDPDGAKQNPPVVRAPNGRDQGHRRILGAWMLQVARTHAANQQARLLQAGLNAGVPPPHGNLPPQSTPPHCHK